MNPFLEGPLTDKGKPIVRWRRKATGQIMSDSRVTEEKGYKWCGAFLNVHKEEVLCHIYLRLPPPKKQI
jgi:hypothetical protein